MTPGARPLHKGQWAVLTRQVNHDCMLTEIDSLDAGLSAYVQHTVRRLVFGNFGCEQFATECVIE